MIPPDTLIYIGLVYHIKEVTMKAVPKEVVKRASNKSIFPGNK